MRPGLRTFCGLEGSTDRRRRVAPSRGGCIGRTYCLLERWDDGADAVAGVGGRDPVHVNWHCWPPSVCERQGREQGQRISYLDMARAASTHSFVTSVALKLALLSYRASQYIEASGRLGR